MFRNSSQIGEDHILLHCQQFLAHNIYSGSQQKHFQFCIKTYLRLVHKLLSGDFGIVEDAV